MLLEYHEDGGLQKATVLREISRVLGLALDRFNASSNRSKTNKTIHYLHHRTNFMALLTVSEKPVLMES